MTSSRLTQGFSSGTIRTLSRVLSDVKSFYDDFTSEELEVIVDTSIEIARACGAGLLHDLSGHKKLWKGTGV